MTYQFRPAVRGQTLLMLGIAGPSRSGKTYSALRLALGMTGGDASKVFCIDTESGRARQYAERFGQFMHCDLQAPFTSDRYEQAILDAQEAGAAVIIVDSMSHEHEGPGGILEQHETELDRMAGQDWGKRDRMKFSAWIKPKAAHNKFVNRVLQVNTHMIFCFRAKDKLVLVKNAKGKQEPVSAGWQPICADRFEYEMTGMIVLPPGANGMPDLGANAAGLREPLDTMIKDGEQLNEALGERLIKWANNGHAKGQPLSQAGNGPDPLEEARAVAAQGTKKFRAWWNGDGKPKRAAVKGHMEELQKIAADADAGGQKEEDPFGLPADEPDEPAETTETPGEDATGDEGPGGGEGTPVDPTAGSPNGEGDHVGKEFGLPPENRDHAKDLAWLKETAAKAETKEILDKWLAKESIQKVVDSLPDDMHEDWLAYIAGLFEALGAMA